MEIGAVKMHMKDLNPVEKPNKHTKRMRDIQKNKKYFFTPSQSTDSEPQLSSPSSSNSNPQSAVQITISVISTDVLRSDTLWALNVVHTHQSMRSAGDKSELFQAIFPGSEIAQKFKMSSAKLAYVINHGLAPYLKMQIIQELAPNSPSLQSLHHLSTSLLTKFLVLKQMDIHVFYFDETKRNVQRVYLGSQFMRHGTVDDIMLDFKKAH